MTPGQRAYEQDVAARPFYEDGTRRKTWAQLGEVEHLSWERSPTPRWFTQPAVPLTRNPINTDQRT